MSHSSTISMKQLLFYENCIESRKWKFKTWKSPKPQIWEPTCIFHLNFLSLDRNLCHPHSYLVSHIHIRTGAFDCQFLLLFWEPFSFRMYFKWLFLLEATNVRYSSADFCARNILHVLYIFTLFFEFHQTYGTVQQKLIIVIVSRNC